MLLGRLAWPNRLADPQLKFGWKPERDTRNLSRWLAGAFWSWPQHSYSNREFSLLFMSVVVVVVEEPLGEPKKNYPSTTELSRELAKCGIQI